ncbi:MAG: HDOD domain-containing protein [Ignavibacteriaceae bacterium]
MSNHYRESLLSIKNLPSIPVIMMEVTKLLGSPKTSANELGRVISRDQGLVAKILTVANSPLYGLPRRVSTIEFAIVILGFDHIKNIVIALSMIEAFKNKDDRNWNRKKYWQHSVLTAVAAKRIADDLGFVKSGEAFTGGLLHDLGISVIQRYFNHEFSRINRMVRERQSDFLSAEEKVLDLTHPEVGRYLLERWNLPKSLGDAVFYHHKPSAAEDNNALAAIVHLADYMTQKFHDSHLLWDADYQLDENIIDILNLGDEKYLHQFIDTYQQLFKNQTDSFLT